MLKMLTVVVMMGCFAASAQAAELRLGYVNIERVLRESAPAQRAEKRIEKEFSIRRQEIEKLVKQARDVQTAMEKEGLKPEELRSKERELSALNQTLQRLQREFREDLNLRKNEELAAVLERAGKAIRALAEAEQFDLIVQEAVYFNPRIDITERVLQSLAEDKPEKAEGK